MGVRASKRVSERDGERAAMNTSRILECHMGIPAVAFSMSLSSSLLFLSSFYRYVTHMTQLKLLL